MQAITDQIDLLKCDGCGLCVTLCSYGAIRAGTAKLKVRDVDSRNVRKLRRLKGIKVLAHPRKILNVIERAPKN
jgi:dihydromethanopterin reductase (acceptor)